MQNKKEQRPTDVPESAEKKPKTIHFRKLDCDTDAEDPAYKAENLQLEILKALNKNDGHLSKKITARETQDDSGDSIILGNFNSNENEFYGAVYLYKKRDHQAVIEFIQKPEENSPQAGISKIRPEDGEEFIRNWVMFYIHKNNCVFVQSSTKGGKWLEYYLDWLLKTAGQNDKKSRLKLQSKFDISILGSDKSKITSVEFGNTVLAPKEHSPRGEFVERTQDKEIAQADKGVSITQAISILTQHLGMSQSDAEKLLEDADNETRIIAKIRLRAISKNREWRQKFYNDIEKALHGVDHRDFKINTKAGHIRGDKAILTDSQLIYCDGGLPMLGDAWRSLKKVYDRWLEDGKLENT